MIDPDQALSELKRWVRKEMNDLADHAAIIDDKTGFHAVSLGAAAARKQERAPTPHVSLIAVKGPFERSGLAGDISPHLHGRGGATNNS